ncbi:flagellar hook-basal body complex protein FliE [Nisaea acidiphila]|uniref:Flagellar hook-basal body complex protein FliE n=1 Tax=Nisaea acidiphila TaxID=1862145 RepID=A0A9J7AYG1_9PROT|nr:flagellar hook-basal body complex protein FliE [Nisaea acidiphila]UUX50469.1 flagellar hook-basal body complex protein FliE [Nisaea acidiphila]
MVANIGNALGAAGIGKVPGMDDAKTGAVGQDFASFVKGAAEDALGTMESGEKMSMKGIAGEADLTDVVQAVNSADITLRTVVALRDKMVQAYQEIIRMPI